MFENQQQLFEKIENMHINGQDKNPASESEIYQYHNEGQLNLHESHFDQTMNMLLVAQNQNQAQKLLNDSNFNQQQNNYYHQPNPNQNSYFPNFNTSDPQFDQSNPQSNYPTNQYYHHQYHNQHPQNLAPSYNYQNNQQTNYQPNITQQFRGMQTQQQFSQEQQNNYQNQDQCYNNQMQLINFNQNNQYSIQNQNNNNTYQQSPQIHLQFPQNNSNFKNNQVQNDSQNNFNQLHHYQHDQQNQNQFSQQNDQSQYPLINQIQNYAHQTYIQNQQQEHGISNQFQFANPQQNSFIFNSSNQQSINNINQLQGTGQAQNIFETQNYNNNNQQIQFYQQNSNFIRNNNPLQNSEQASASIYQNNCTLQQSNLHQIYENNPNFNNFDNQNQRLNFNQVSKQNNFIQQFQTQIQSYQPIDINQSQQALIQEEYLLASTKNQQDINVNQSKNPQQIQSIQESQQKSGMNSNFQQQQAFQYGQNQEIQGNQQNIQINECQKTQQESCINTAAGYKQDYNIQQNEIENSYQSYANQNILNAQQANFQGNVCLNNNQQSQLSHSEMQNQNHQNQSKISNQYNSCSNPNQQISVIKNQTGSVLYQETYTSNNNEQNFNLNDEYQQQQQQQQPQQNSQQSLVNHQVQKENINNEQNSQIMIDLSQNQAENEKNWNEQISSSSIKINQILSEEQCQELFQKQYEIKYGDQNQKNSIRIEATQFSLNEVNFQFLCALNQFINLNFDSTKYYNKNKLEIFMPQTLSQYAEEKFPHNQKKKQLFNKLQESQEGYKYILDLRRGEHSFFRATITGFLISLLSEKSDEDDDVVNDQKQLILQIFTKFFYMECQNITLNENPYNEINDLKLYQNYKSYFLNCFLYLLAHKINNFSSGYIISELLEMCYKDEAFDFSMICFGIQLCNIELNFLQNDKVFKQFFDSFFQQIDCYQFEMNEIYQQSLVHSLQTDIKMFSLTIDPKDKSKMLMKEELIIPGEKYIISNIKMIKVDSFYKLVFDSDQKHFFKYFKDFTAKVDKLSQYAEPVQEIQQQDSEYFECAQCGKKLEFEKDLHIIQDEKSKLMFSFCLEHIFEIVNKQFSDKNHKIPYKYHQHTTNKDFQIFVDRLSISCVVDKIITQQFPQLKTQCFECKSKDESKLINLVTFTKILQPVICLSCALEKIKESNYLKEKHIKFKNLLNKEDLINIKELFQNFIKRENELNKNCSCCKKNQQRYSKNLSIQNIYIVLNLCEECNKLPRLKLDKINIFIDNNLTKAQLKQNAEDTKNKKQNEEEKSQVERIKKQESLYQNQLTNITSDNVNIYQNQNFSQTQKPQILQNKDHEQCLTKQLNSLKISQKAYQQELQSNLQQVQKEIESISRANQSQIKKDDISSYSHNLQVNSNQLQKYVLKQDSNIQIKNESTNKQQGFTFLNSSEQQKKEQINQPFLEPKKLYHQITQQTIYINNHSYQSVYNFPFLQGHQNIELSKITQSLPYQTQVPFLQITNQKSPTMFSQIPKQNVILSPENSNAKTVSQKQNQAPQESTLNVKYKLICLTCPNKNLTNSILINLQRVSKQYKGNYCLNCILEKFSNFQQRFNIYSKAQLNKLFYCCKCGENLDDTNLKDLILKSLEKNTLEYYQCRKCSFKACIKVYQ